MIHDTDRRRGDATVDPVNGHVIEEDRGGGLEVPWAPLPKLSTEARAAIEAEALRLNDRYLLEVIERYAFCPFAKEGRAAGETRRTVLIADSPSIEPFLTAMRETIESGVVVAQVIVPLIEVGPAEFARFCVELTAAGHARRGGPPVLAVAPLHPELPFGETPLAMVPLFRRSPDPTLQWVRLDGLASIYADRSSEDVYVSPANVLEYVEKHGNTKPRSLYDRIAQTNTSMAERLGIPQVVELLGAIAVEGRDRYADILRAQER